MWRRLLGLTLAVSGWHGLVMGAETADSGLPQAAVQVLKERCWSCHGATVGLSGLKLNSREATLQGGGRGPAIVPGDPGHSRLMLAVTHAAQPAMPPGKKLSDEEIATLQKWVAAGAVWPKETPSAPAPTWWSFQKPKRPAVPAVQEAWVRTPIDAFILQKLQQQRLAPAAEADRRALIRRATYDLHGLPPTPERIEAFVQDRSPDSYEKLIDELLASPRYGEKWGRHWLDLVRYGDTSGFEQDPYLLYAWRYRDYVIQSFNEDKPYDRFIKEQLAGDELYPDDPVAQSGTGYFTVGANRDMLFKVEDINRVETLTDFTDTTASVFLGLTVGCARCHDHKFDPIPQRDYYRLQSIFVPLEKTRVFLQYDPARSYDLGENTRQWRLRELGDQLERIFKPYQKRISDEKLAKLDQPVRNAFAVEEAKRTPAQRDLVAQYQAKIRAPQDEVRALMTADDTAKLKKIETQLVGMYLGYKAGPFAPGVHDMSREAPKVFLPARGGAARGELVEPGFLSALGGGNVPEPSEDAVTTYRRKALAEWIANPSHPLTARVMVNRIWQYHFGQGLVTTASDFGTRGTAPSHPELLDWLATDFVENGWSMKKLHRQIMLSSVYRQGVTPSPEALKVDPTNRYLSHANRRRLSPEEIRDSVLQASGDLNLKMGGRPVVPPVDKEELFGLSLSPDTAWIVTDNPEEQHRRSVYLMARRTLRSSLFETFDMPDGIRSCPRREASNTAPQSLTLLNGRFTVEQAKSLGRRLASDSKPIAPQAWRTVFGRTPTADEAASAERFVKAQEAELHSRDLAAAELVRALLNTNEFLYVD